MRCHYCNRQYKDLYIHYDEIVPVCKSHLNDCIESFEIAMSRYESRYQRLIDEE